MGGAEVPEAPSIGGMFVGGMPFPLRNEGIPLSTTEPDAQLEPSRAFPKTDTSV